MGIMRREVRWQATCRWLCSWLCSCNHRLCLHSLQPIQFKQKQEGHDRVGGKVKLGLLCSWLSINRINSIHHVDAAHLFSSGCTDPTASCSAVSTRDRHRLPARSCSNLSSIIKWWSVRARDPIRACSASVTPLDRLISSYRNGNDFRKSHLSSSQMHLSTTQWWQSLLVHTGRRACCAASMECLGLLLCEWRTGRISWWSCGGQYSDIDKKASSPSWTWSIFLRRMFLRYNLYTSACWNYKQ